MHRLLQGEVGSGKTVCALRAMLQVVDAGGQAALLAPTEVLAAQHYRSIARPARAAGPGRRARRRPRRHPGRAGHRLAGRGGPARGAGARSPSGEAGIVVGTHALLYEGVDFADLGLVVVDEQHRFGVEQRDALRAKAEPAAARAGHDRHADPAHGGDDGLRRPGDLHADRAAARPLADRVARGAGGREAGVPRPGLAAAARGGRGGPPGVRGLPAHRRRGHRRRRGRRRRRTTSRPGGRRWR